jgi:hypothetical protein
MKLFLQIFILLLTLVEGVSAQQQYPPRFEDLPVIEKYRGKPAPVKLTSQRAKTFRTMIRDNTKQGVNFAGHYIAATWGCGSDCWSFAIIDARTGIDYLPPSLLWVGGFGYSPGQDRIQFRKNSRLLVAVGALNDKGSVGKYYFLWKDNRLRLIRAIADKEYKG